MSACRDMTAGVGIRLRVATGPMVSSCRVGKEVTGGFRVHGRTDGAGYAQLIAGSFIMRNVKNDLDFPQMWKLFPC